MDIVQSIVLVLHLLVSAGLILLVLLHSGKDGGVSDMFGGGFGPASQSTVVEKNLDRLTVITSLVFTVTTVTLVLIWT
jgi:preprotein translocase subunit SecG